MASNIRSLSKEGPYCYRRIEYSFTPGTSTTYIVGCENYAFVHYTTGISNVQLGWMSGYLDGFSSFPIFQRNSTLASATTTDTKYMYPANSYCSPSTILNKYVIFGSSNSGSVYLVTSYEAYTQPSFGTLGTTLTIVPYTLIFNKISFVVTDTVVKTGYSIENNIAYEEMDVLSGSGTFAYLPTIQL